MEVMVICPQGRLTEDIGLTYCRSEILEVLKWVYVAVGKESSTCYSNKYVIAMASNKSQIDIFNYSHAQSEIQLLSLVMLNIS